MTFVVSLEEFQPGQRYDGRPWTQARIEEAAVEEGPFTPIETQALSPLDTNFEQPRSRNFTTALATNPSGWYRVVFLDAAGAEQIAGPVYFPATAIAGITLEEFKRYVNVQHDEKDTLLSFMLRSGAAFVASYTSRQLEPLVDPTTLARRLTSSRFLQLPDARRIDEVKLDGVVVATSGYELGPLGADTMTHLELLGEPTMTTESVLEVTGAFGFEVLPDDLREAILASAARRYYRRAAGFADSVQSEELGVQSFFRQLPSDIQATLEMWRVGELLRLR